jgi:Spy/CpxP family protein refolding chaperone
MSRFYTIALGLALSGGAAVTTNAQAASTATKADTTAITRHHDRNQTRRGARERGDRALFKGIDLSSAQKAKIDSIRSQYRSESRSLREQMGPAMKDARAARQSGDSAKVAEARANMSASRDKMMELRKQELSEIRGVLTSEQRSTFDKNVDQLRSRMRQGRGARRSARSGGSAH